MQNKIKKKKKKPKISQILGRLERANKYLF